MPITTQQRSIYEYALQHLQTEKARLDGLIADINRQLPNASPVAIPVPASTEPKPKKATRKRRTMSADAKARIAAAQKKRWAEYHKAQAKTASTKTSPKKSTMMPDPPRVTVGRQSPTQGSLSKKR
jgi:hypothetical protein